MCNRCDELGQVDAGHEIQQATAGGTSRRTFLASSAATLAFAQLPFLSTLAEAASNGVPAKGWATTGGATPLTPFSFSLRNLRPTTS